MNRRGVKDVYDGHFTGMLWTFSDGTLDLGGDRGRGEKRDDLEYVP